MKNLELLAPAKNLECGIAAINNGADAVYIGAPKFGARSAACNSIQDITELTRYAHQYGAKVYVTLNTIIYDNEIDDVIDIITQLYNADVDALLIQDMAIAELAKEIDCPPLHASTQMDIRTPEKVQWLSEMGFRRVVLARELSLTEISAIHKAVPDIELEVFVHGALCVSYSGQCFASQYCFNRSANRGECAQFCRLKFDLVDSNNRLIAKDKYLLSLKDMKRIERLDDLIQAGAVSFKIEGRLKDSDYVKNVTAAYSQALNNIVAQHDDYRRSSFGHCEYSFTPDLNKTFNRGYTTYFLDGRAEKIANFDTPKSKGEYVGDVKEITRQFFKVAGTSAFANGDGLCFINKNGILEGFRINRAEGNKLFPHIIPQGLFVGAKLFRNNDTDFQHILNSANTKRKVSLEMIFKESKNGFSLFLTDEMGHSATEALCLKKEIARTPQRPNIQLQLTKLGNTIFECKEVKIELSDNWFIPSSILADLRRKAVEKLTENISISHEVSCAEPKDAKFPYLQQHLSYLANVSNHIAENFYHSNGAADIEPAFEIQQPAQAKLIMQCKHCILHSLGQCRKTSKAASEYGQLYLILAEKQRFRLDFDCRKCQMNIYAE